MSKTLMILFPEKAPDTKHICYRGGCPLFTGEVQDGLCKTLWETPPESMKGKTACMCNFYDTRNPVIVEADGVDIQETIKRVEGKQQPQGLDEASASYQDGIGIYHKSQEPVEWSEEDKRIFQHCLVILHDYGYDIWLNSLVDQLTQRQNKGGGSL